MDKGKLKIILFDENKLEYRVLATRKNAEVPENLYCFEAKEIDKRFLLMRDTAWEKGQIFGIADTRGEADKRIYNEALKKAEEFEKFYSERLGYKIEFKDLTEREKSIDRES